MPFYRQHEPLESYCLFILKTFLGGLLCVLVTGCQSPAPESQLDIGIASSLAAPFEQWMPKQNDLETPKPTYASSGSLVTMWHNGRDFDQLILADLSYDKEFPENIPRTIIGQSQIFLLTSENLTTNWHEFLRRTPGPVAIADPEVAPVGRAALQACEQAGVNREQDFWVRQGQASQVLHPFITGTVTAAIVAEPQLNQLPYPETFFAYPIEQELYQPIQYVRYDLDSSPELDTWNNKLEQLSQSRLLSSPPASSDSHSSSLKKLNLATSCQRKTNPH